MGTASIIRGIVAAAPSGMVANGQAVGVVRG